MSKNKRRRDPYDHDRRVVFKAHADIRSEVAVVREASIASIDEWERANGPQIASILEALGQVATIEALPHAPERSSMTFNIAQTEILRQKYSEALQRRDLEFSGTDRDALSWLGTVSNKLGLGIQLPVRPAFKAARSKENQYFVRSYMGAVNRFDAQLPEALSMIRFSSSSSSEELERGI